MPLTNKEKQQRKREKLKADPEKWKLHLEKDRARKNTDLKTKLSGMSEKQKALHQAKEAERVRLYRHNKKGKITTSAVNLGTSNILPASSSATTPYKSKQSLGKAIKKVKNVLPESPNKRTAVISKIAEQAGFKISPGKHTNKSHVAKGLSAENTQLIIKFYERDDISWQAPGKKDRVIYREKCKDTGKVLKTEVQTRYLVMSLSEAFSAFNAEQPDIVHKSKFASLRPKHVKLFDSIPHNVCVCTYHENVRLLLLALKEHCSLPTEFRPFVDKIVCDSENKQCMNRTCLNCAGLLGTYLPKNDDVTSSPVKYYQWQKKGQSAYEKTEVLGTVQCAIDELLEQVKPFLIHTFIKRKQAGMFNKLKEEANGTDIVLQVDFSENAALVQQNEIQSAHWHHKQATLFTSYVWISEKIGESIVIVSNDMEHCKLQVFVYMEKIFEHLKTMYPEIKIVNIFSDGAGSQFKQRYIFSSLHLIEEKFDVSIKWHFFATSHGKGVIDGVGGTVKRSVWRSVRSERCVVNTAYEFVTVAEAKNPSIEFIYVDEVSIDNYHAKDILETLWDKARPIPKCHQVHYVETSGKNKLKVAEFSSDSNLVSVRINNFDEDDDIGSTELLSSINNVPISDLKIDSWVLVRYEDNIFPGIVMNVFENEAEVSVMHRSGAYYKWPVKPDQIIYRDSDI